jgi:hypothetical protein
MSFTATNAAWTVDGLNTAAKFVLVALADHRSHRTGLCCPGNERLARHCALSLSGVKKALKELQIKGLIAIRKLGKQRVFPLRETKFQEAPRVAHWGSRSRRCSSPKPTR